MIFLRSILDQHQVKNRPTLWITLTACILLALSCSRPKGLFVESIGSPFSVGSSPNTLVIGDFNGDGKLDLAIPNAGNNNITILLGNGTGGFTKAPDSPIQVGSGPSTVAIGDFNGDCKLDLAVGNEDTPNLTILLGDGKGGFNEAKGSPYKIKTRKWYLGGPSWPIFLTVGDFNRDGKLDLVYTTIKDNNVTELLGDGTGCFTEAPISPFSVGTNPKAVTIGDINGDGNQDIIITNTGGNNVTVFLGNGSGGFKESQGSPFSVGKFPQSVAIGDFNGDGKPDLAIVNGKSNNVTVLLGNGLGGFSKDPGSPFTLGPVLNPFKSGTWPFCVAIGDFNGDGKQDLAIANTNNIVTVLRGNGTGGFTEDSDSPFRVGSLPKWVAVGDFNGDGKPDLVTVNRNDNNVTVLLNSYSGSSPTNPSNSK